MKSSTWTRSTVVFTFLGDKVISSTSTGWQRLQAAPHGPKAPVVEKAAGPGHGFVLMKLTKQERVIEKIALLLLQLKPDYIYNTLAYMSEDDRMHKVYAVYESAANDAVSMVDRAARAIDVDPSWWKIEGKPHWNERMTRLRVALRKKK